MRGHVKPRGTGYAYWIDTGSQPAQRCTKCNHRAWIDRGRLVAECPKCTAPMGAPYRCPITKCHAVAVVGPDDGTECPKCGVEMVPMMERRQVTKAGFRTKREAETAMRAHITVVEKGGDPVPADITFAEWAEKWLASDVVRALRPHTRSRYRQILADHVLPHVGSLKLTAVRRRHVMHVLDEVTKKGLARRSVAETKAVMSSCLARAVEAELIDANPALGWKLGKAERKELVVPTSDELVAVMTAARGTTWEIPLLLAATTGMRRSEVLGLRWAFVDLDTGRASVVAGLQRVRDEDGSRLELLDAKTDKSKRSVTLMPEVAERLRRWRTEQTERRLRLGPAWVDTGFVCDRGDGGPLDPDSFSTGFKRIAKGAGLPAGMRPHDLRHGVATMMLAQGVHPAIASAMLGHSSPSFTMAQYQHVRDEMTDVAAGAIGDGLGEAFRQSFG